MGAGHLILFLVAVLETFPRAALPPFEVVVTTGVWIRILVKPVTPVLCLFAVVLSLRLCTATQQTARLLGISRKTADRHRATLMEKLDIRNSASLTRYAVRNRVIEP